MSEAHKQAPDGAPVSDQKRASVWLLALMQLAILLFSCSTLLTKFAARHPVLSWNWILLYGASLGVMAIYALCWQQFLKRVPLTTAYANRAAVMFWGMVFGALVFKETITWNMIVGVIVIFIGICLVVTGDEK